MASQTLHITGMHCASCVDRVERALKVVPGVADVAVNLALGQARVESGEGATPDPTALRRAVEAAGYTLSAEPVSTVAPATDRRLWIAAILTAPVLVLSMLEVHFPFRDILFLLIAIPVQFWSGWPFLAGAGRLLRRRAADMNTLIALGTLAAFGYSAVITLTKPLNDHGGHVYFEAQMVIITLILL